jgi:hypothetical protein
MPLEDLTGNKFIADLNENWPAGTDYPDAGDDHIRGVKNVLKRQFPNLGRTPVTATAAQLMSGGVPIGSVMIFYQATPPTGWKRTTIDATRALRVVATATAGGGSGGSDDPILNDKVPSHLHSLDITSGQGSVNHTHGGITSSAGAHSHSYTENYVSGNFPFGNNATYPPVAQRSAQTGSAGAHTHAISADGAAHPHNLAGDTQANAGAANWVPRYIDVIVCERET